MKKKQIYAAVLGAFLGIAVGIGAAAAEDDSLFWDLAWHAKLAGYGDAESLYRMGMIYEEGHGVMPDARRALDFYKRAGQRGNIDACMKLGRIYADGLWVAADAGQTLFWYEQAARRGYAPAQLKLSELYEAQTPPDYRQSYEWLERAMRALFPNRADLREVSPDLARLEILLASENE